MGLSILGWIVVGLIAGALAKLILPGRQGGGIIATLILGVIGGLVGGFLGQLLFGKGGGGVGSIWTWILAVGGSIVVLLIWGLITGRKAPRD